VASAALALGEVLAMKPRPDPDDEPFASLDAIVRARVVKTCRTGRAREDQRSVVTHDLEEALSLSGRGLSAVAGPRAHITEHYPVQCPRPRDPSVAHAPAFAPLSSGLWFRPLARSRSRAETA